jgi:hypothetical protein
LPLFPLLGLAQPPRMSIAAVDFFGSAPVDFVLLRAAFPFHTGAAFEPRRIALSDTPEEFRKLVGKNRSSVDLVYIPDLRGLVMYVDVEPPAAAQPVWKPKPTGAVGLPPEIVALYEHAMDRFENGGIEAGDETDAGYSLSKDPIMRADELKLIDYARAHASEVYRVLEDPASARDRIAAAWIAGYAPQGKDQVAALLGAVDDPDSTVRNNAIRVLGVLAYHDADFAGRISPDPFIPMLRSLTWTDRNKAMMLLGPITARHNPKTLEALRREAAQPLRQMAGWTYWGHAAMALTLLGRIAGIPEDRLQKLLEAHDAAAILKAAARPAGD